MLQKQKVPISINEGLDTKTDEPNVPATRFLEAENITYQKLGAATKRFGYTQLPKSVLGLSDLSSATSLSRFNNELALTTTEGIYAYAADKSTWVRRDNFDHYMSSEATVANSGRAVSNGFHAQTGNTIAFIYTQKTLATATYVTTLLIKDKDTDTILYTTTLTSQTATVAAITGGYLVLDGTNGYFYDTSTLSMSAAVINANFAVSDLIGIGAYAYGIYINGFDVKFVKIDSARTVLASYTHNTGSAPGAICLNADGSNVRFFVTNPASVNIYAYLFDLNLSLINLGYYAGADQPNAFITSCQSATSNATDLFIDSLQSNQQCIFVVRCNSTAPYAVGSQNVLFQECKLAAKAIRANSLVYLPVVNAYRYIGAVNESTNTQTLQIMAINNSWGYSSPVAYFDYENVRDAVTSSARLASTLELSGVMSTLVTIFTELVSNYPTTASNTPMALNIVTWNASATADISKVYSQGNLIFNGAQPKMYDGNVFVEQGFISPPQILDVVQSSPLGLSYPVGDYGLVAVWAWYDAQGNLHRSAPGNFILVNVSGITTRFTITTSRPTLSLKTNINCEIYMTDTNGSLYYKVKTLSYVNNNHTSAQQTFNQTYQSTALSANEQLYTDGGALPNDALQPSYALALHKNRVFSINMNRDSISYSQIISTGYPANFNNAYTMSMNFIGGQLSALATMDNFLVLFKENAIYALAGEGPNNLGQQDDYGTPQYVTTDTGCSDHNSVVTMPAGIMFNSPKGIYQLSRSLSSSYIGAPVEAYNGGSTKSFLMPAVNEVRFAMDSGTTLTYDYYTQRWSTTPSQSAIDMALDADNNYYYLKADASVRKQSAAYADNGSFIPIKLTSAWISLGGIQGYERFYKLHILGEFKSSHKLKVSLAYDYVDSFTESVTIDSSTLTSTQLYELIIRPSRQKCSSFKFKIEDLDNGVSGESLVISNFALEVGVKAGNNKRAAGFNFGTT